MDCIKQTESRVNLLNRMTQRTSDELKEDFLIFKEKFELSQRMEVQNQLDLQNYVAHTGFQDFSIQTCKAKREMFEYWKVQKEVASTELQNIMEELHYRAIFHSANKPNTH